MGLADDLKIIARQEAELVFERLDENVAWKLGTLLRDWASEGNWPVVIDIRTPSRPLFFAALPRSVPDNVEWVRRKSNTVMRFYRSSYAIGLELRLNENTLENRYGLSTVDYAVHGGSFPIAVRGTGVVGSVTVSGLPQREDHATIVRAICALFGHNHDDYALSPEGPAS